MVRGRVISQEQVKSQPLWINFVCRHHVDDTGAQTVKIFDEPILPLSAKGDAATLLACADSVWLSTDTRNTASCRADQLKTTDKAKRCLDFRLPSVAGKLAAGGASGAFGPRVY